LQTGFDFSDRFLNHFSRPIYLIITREDDSSSKEHFSNFASDYSRPIRIRLGSFARSLVQTTRAKMGRSSPEGASAQNVLSGWPVRRFAADRNVRAPGAARLLHRDVPVLSAF
jgi:hypothetical protein